jgi:hypothetical protein
MQAADGTIDFAPPGATLLSSPLIACRCRRNAGNRTELDVSRLRSKSREDLIELR